MAVQLGKGVAKEVITQVADYGIQQYALPQIESQIASAIKK